MLDLSWSKYKFLVCFARGTKKGQQEAWITNHSTLLFCFRHNNVQPVPMCDIHVLQFEFPFHFPCNSTCYIKTDSPKCVQQAFLVPSQLISWFHFAGLAGWSSTELRTVGYCFHIFCVAMYFVMVTLNKMSFIKPLILYCSECINRGFILTLNIWGCIQTSMK